MVKELREWLKEDSENVITNSTGHAQDLTSWYTDFGIKIIWVACADNEHELGTVAVKLPEDRAQLIRFLLEGLDHTEECRYSETHNMLHVSFDG